MADVNSWMDVYRFPASNTSQLFSESEALFTQDAEDNSHQETRKTQISSWLSPP